MKVSSYLISRRKVLASLGVALAPLPAAAQGTGPAIRMVVPYNAGGATDIAGRVIAAQLSRELGQRVVVENMGGAGGNIGAAAVARATPDGGTLLFNATGPTAVFLAAGLKLPYDPSRELQPIGTVASFQNCVVVSATLPIKTLEELVRYGKDHPGKLTYGTASLGSVGHLHTEMFARAAGIQIIGVPYKGSSQLILDLISGTVQVAFDTLPAWVPHAASGKVVPLAVNGVKRSVLMPGVPTLLELGYRGFENPPPFALFAPAGLPDEIARRFRDALNRAIADPAVMRTLQEQGFAPEPGGPERVNAILNESTEAFRTVIRDAGIKLQ